MIKKLCLRWRKQDHIFAYYFQGSLKGFTLCVARGGVTNWLPINPQETILHNCSLSLWPRVSKCLWHVVPSLPCRKNSYKHHDMGDKSSFYPWLHFLRLPHNDFSDTVHRIVLVHQNILQSDTMFSGHLFSVCIGGKLCHFGRSSFRMF